MQLCTEREQRVYLILQDCEPFARRQRRHPADQREIDSIVTVLRRHEFSLLLRTRIDIRKPLAKRGRIRQGDRIAMRFRVSFLLIALGCAASFPRMSRAESPSGCPITKAPEHPFIPPALDRVTDGTFVLGSPMLWTRVTTHWLLNRTGNKLPYHSEVYTRYKLNNPPLAVMARRLDASEPLVWAERINNAFQLSPGARADDIAARGGTGAMITALPIPTAGCWEISAHYTPAGDKVHTLTYTVWVDAGFPAPAGMSSAENRNGCPVTKAPEHPIVPPPPFDTANRDGTLALGTPGLWASVPTRWLLHRDNEKLPYHSDAYIPNWPDSAPLAVVARRLDGPEPLVWAERVNGAFTTIGARWDDLSLPIPRAGCWEISAHYPPAQKTLTYIVRVEDVGIPAPGTR